MSDRKRLLNDLRVIDLRAELEKRNLDKGGVRSVLIQRLSKHLEEEGLDPTTFKFDIVGPDPKTPKKVRRSGSAVDQEAEETPAMEDMIVQDDAGEEEDPEQSTKDKKQEPKSEEKMDVEDSEKISRKRESNDDSEVTPPKKPCLEKETKTEDDLKDANTDAEDSINLDINEYELLNDEGDNNTTSKKDEGGEQEAAAADDAPAPRDPRDARDAAALAEQTEHQPDNAEPAANSYEVDKNGEKEDKDEKDKNGEAEKGEKKEEGKESGARNLWISGLSGDTRAKDLKQLCTKYGKVIGAKVVTNARTPGSRCYGYVTMASAQDAENCIKNLHRTELHGRMISVEKAKSESESASRRQPSRNERRASKDHSRDEGKENEDKKEGDKDEEGKERPKKEGDEPAEESRSQSRTREKSQRSDKDKKRSTRSRERGGRRSPREVLSFSKIWKERDAARARSRARAAREEERRRRAADDALRERERRQRQEKHRLALEREKLRQEREKIEREKNELLRLERERHRLEREKLELERLELKRAQLRLEEERRKRGYESAYRKAGSPPPEPAYERERHKRAAPPSAKIPSSRSGHFEAPPPPRFDVGAAYERDKRDSRDTRDYKRDYPRHAASATSMKYSSNGSANDDARQPMPPGTRPKEPSRTYESREGGRGYRSPPSNKAEHRWLPPAHAAHHDASTASKGSSGAGEHWSGEARYGASYEPRYSSAFQPPPPGAAYPDRYPPPAAHAPHAAHPTHAAHAPRDYPRKY